MPQDSVAPSIPLPSPPPRLSAPARIGVGLVARTGGLLVLLLAGLAAPGARASSPRAWRAYDQEVRTACLRASGLRQPRVLGERVDVPVADRTPDGGTPLISALLLEGRWPQPALRGQTGRELCLFEQRTRKATVADAENLAKPRPKP
jgi:hypothetical protein